MEPKPVKVILESRTYIFHNYSMDFQTLYK